MIIAPNSRELLKTIVREDDGEMLFVVLEHLEYFVDGHEFDVPAGYVSDGFSLPPFLKPLFRKLFLNNPLLIYAAVAHDWLYRKDKPARGVRHCIDKIFYLLLLHYSASYFISILFRSAVTAFGWMFYRKKDASFYPL